MVRILSSPGFYIFRDNHPQCTAPNPVFKWSGHHFDFTVECNPHAFSGCLYLHFVRTKRKEISVVAQTSDHSTQCKPYQFQTTCSVCYVNAELTSIKTITHPDIEQIHFILIVTNKHKGSRPVEDFVVNAKSNIEKWISA